MTKMAVLFASACLLSAPAVAENVEIYLLDLLDNTQDGYCVDIAGGRGDAADPADGLQGHTCYSPTGELLVDQIFDTERFAEGLLYMPEFDVCASLPSNDAGTIPTLETCDGSDAQSFVFTGEGTITPASATDMCLTVAEDTRSGRSDANQIKVLSVESCDDASAAYQTWGVRTAE